MSRFRDGMAALLRVQSGKSADKTESETGDPYPQVFKPKEEDLDSIAQFLRDHEIFLAQSRAMGCQITISRRLEFLLREHCGADIDWFLAHVSRDVQSPD